MTCTILRDRNSQDYPSPPTPHPPPPTARVIKDPVSPLSLLIASHIFFYFSDLCWVSLVFQDHGPQGRAGVKGQIGDKGSQGIPGPRGDRGREGPPGKSGPGRIKGIKGQQ